MTNQEFNEKYKDVELKFTVYYKYSFSFKGIAHDGVEIFASYGGNHDDIYRYDVSAEKAVKFDDLDRWNYVSAKKDNEQIFEHFGDF